MGLFHLHQHFEDAFNTICADGFDAQQHEPSKLHEMLAGAAAFAAMRQYEEKRKAEGFHDHGLAREMIAGFAAAEVDKLVETKGLDVVDAELAKRSANEQAAQMYDTYYSQG